MLFCSVLYTCPITRRRDRISPPEGETRFVFTRILSACANYLTSACAMTEWKSIALVSKEINLELTLCSGQAFRWVRGEEGEWRGAIGEK